MKLNNKGFAISSVMYAALIMFLIIMIGTLTVMASTKVLLDKKKTEIITKLEDSKGENTSDVWLSGFKYRLEFVIDGDKIDEDLTHFPLSIYLNKDNGNDIFSKIGDSFEEIAITKKGSNEQLYVEVENWDSANKKAVLHASSPTLVLKKGKKQRFYLYYDSEFDTSNYVGQIGTVEAASVWDGAYTIVNHMNQNLKNSKNPSSNIVNNGVTFENGLYSDIAKFEGDDSLVFQENLTNNYTKLVKFKPSLLAGDGRNLLSTNTTSHAFWIANGKLKSGHNTNTFYVNEGIRLIEENQNYVGAATYNSENDTLTNYLNGTIDNVTASIPQQPDNSLIAGSFHYANFYQGLMDEIRVSNIVRSDAWIKAESYDLNNALINFVEKKDGIYWLLEYKTRQLIKIDGSNITEDLTYFPVTIKLDEANNEDFFSKIGSNPNLVTFTLADGITKVFAELDYFNASLKKAVYHVSSESLKIKSNIDTHMYIYYDQSVLNNTSTLGASGSSPAAYVWDKNYKFVNHLNANLKNSSLYSGTGTNMGASFVDSPYGSAANFGMNNRIDWGTNLVNSPSLSVTSYCNVDNDSGDEFWVLQNYDGTSQAFVYDINFSYGLPRQRFYMNGSLGFSNTEITENIWHGYAVSRSTSNLVNFYYNGALDGTATVSNPIGDVNTRSGDSISLDGNLLIDELRVSNIERSSNWLKTEQLMLKDTPVSFGFIENK